MPITFKLNIMYHLVMNLFFLDLVGSFNQPTCKLTNNEKNKNKQKPNCIDTQRLGGAYPIPIWTSMVWGFKNILNYR